jgi:hypothetical protein
MEWAALGIAIISLIVSINIFFLTKARRQENDTVFFSPAPVKSSKAKKPVVRDELAGWRLEQEERYEWEQRLKEKA